VLRDQGRLFGRTDLSSILADDFSVADWVGLLNRRVYVFADRSALQKLLDKYVRRDGSQEVLTLSLRDSFGRLGRGSSSLGTTPAPFGARRASRSGRTCSCHSHAPDSEPAEVTVVDGLADVGVVVYAHRYFADGRIESLPSA